MAVLKETESKDVDKLLAKLPIEMREKAFKKALRARGRIVIREANRRAPVGDPNHNPSKMALKDTFKQVVRTKRGKIMLVVGADWPEGSHVHLVEFGHKMIAHDKIEKIGPRVEGKEFFAPAIDTTQAEQTRKMIEVLSKEAAKVSK